MAMGAEVRVVPFEPGDGGGHQASDLGGLKAGKRKKTDFPPNLELGQGDRSDFCTTL